MTTTAIRPAPNGAHYVPRGTCLGKQNPDCTARRHGTYSAYWYGCRCPHARNDYRLYQKRKREGREQPRLINATGTQRRIQALWALGHSSDTIGAAGGITGFHVQRIARARDLVTNGTWQAIDRAYRALNTTPGTSTVTRNRAARAGYAPPLAWDDIDDPNAQPDLGDPDADSDTYDPTTVAQAVEGRLTHAQLEAHRPDLIETVRRLATQLGDNQIAHLLRWPGLTQTRADGTNRATNTISKLRADNNIPTRPRPTPVYAYPRSRDRKPGQPAPTQAA